MPGKWKYKSFEEAANASSSKKAIAKIEIEHKGRRVRAELVKPLHRDGYIVYEGTGIAIRPATSSEVDSRPRWDDF